jgi:diaminopimelate decarboxylase
MKILESNELGQKVGFSMEFRREGEDILIRNGGGFLSLLGIYKELRDRYTSRFRGAIIYSEETFRGNLKATALFMQKHFGDRYRLLWAVKSAPVKKLVEIAAEEGASFDAGSCEELLLAREFSPGERIYHTSPGKFEWDIEAIVKNDCVSISDNMTELTLLNERAGALGKKLQVGLRINPAVHGSTQSEIATGTLDCKFGIPELSDAFLGELRGLSNLDLNLLHMHIGSQIADPADYEKALGSMFRAFFWLKSAGFEIETIDIGGGFPHQYLGCPPGPEAGSHQGSEHVFHSHIKHPFEEYARRIHAVLKEAFGSSMPRVAIEPGRHIAAGAAFALGYVLHAKHYPNGIRWIISSVSVNDFYHKMCIPDTFYDVHLIGQNGGCALPTAIGGTLCFSGDILTPRGHAVNLPGRAERGDILFYNNVGAYSLLGSGNFHNMPRLPILMIDSRSSLIEIRGEEIPYFEEHPFATP